MNQTGMQKKRGKYTKPEIVSLGEVAQATQNVGQPPSVPPSS